MTEHLRRLFDPALLILVAVFAVGLRLALAAGLFGLPLAIVLVSWLFKYAYVLLEDVAHGIQTPRVMSIEMVNPIEQRPLVQLVICATAVMAVRATDGWPALVLASVFAFLLPASVAILGASGNVLQAVNPVALVRVIAALGRYYVVVLVALAALGLGAWGVTTADIPVTLRFAYLAFAVLAQFNLIGGALYERRADLDLVTIASPEQAREREERDHEQERRRLIDDLYVNVRARKYGNLEAPIDHWFAGIDDACFEPDGQALVAAARSWEDRRGLSVIALSVIGHLHAAQRNMAALDVFESALAADPGFHLPRGRDAIALVELAMAAGRRPLARRILETAAAVDTDDYESRRLDRLRASLER